jgi:hypothetical protein
MALSFNLMAEQTGNINLQGVKNAGVGDPEVIDEAIQEDTNAIAPEKDQELQDTEFNNLESAVFYQQNEMIAASEERRQQVMNFNDDVKRALINEDQ